MALSWKEDVDQGATNVKGAKIDFKFAREKKESNALSNENLDISEDRTIILGIRSSIL